MTKHPESGAPAESVIGQATPEFPNEEILPDDYPVYGDYLYVADGKVIRSDLHDSTVGRLKRLLGAKEIRRCNISARQAAMEHSNANEREAGP